VAILRFPNPGSDFAKLVKTFQILYMGAHKETSFDLDFAVRVLIEQGQVSSSGAVGKEALKRSTRKDRSRDPLYNQLKMYSELFRMLGWIHPGAKKLDFHATMLGKYVGEGRLSDPNLRSLVQECLMSITFPNPNTENVGIVRLRPFLQLLRLMKKLDGFMARDEIIVSLYTLIDDSQEDEFDKRVNVVKNLRGNIPLLKKALKVVAGSIQVNTLHNYTRFPLGVLKSPIVGWALDESREDIYGEPLVFYKLTNHGAATVEAFETLVDIRASQLEGFTLEERAHFLSLGYYAMLKRAGYSLKPVESAITRHARNAERVLAALKVPKYESIYFSPYQQAAHGDLAAAERLG